jgi:hypothetical protein
MSWKTLLKIKLSVVAVVFGLRIEIGSGQPYRWLENTQQTSTIASRIAVADGYARIPVDEGSFAIWIRQLPLRPEGTAVRLYNRELKDNQGVHHAVIDIDVGNQDLQQCADAIIRLRAEYLYSAGRSGDIHFNFSSGDTAWWGVWRDGFRPDLQGDQVAWNRTADTDSSYETFRRYLDCVMIYAGTYSLRKEMEKAPDLRDMQIGDVFIQGGFPGHAVMVVDMALNTSTGERLFLLAQSFMPAQDIHILRNPDGQFDPWYVLEFEEELHTPEWTFSKDDLYRFKD